MRNLFTNFIYMALISLSTSVLAQNFEAEESINVASEPEISLPAAKDPLLIETDGHLAVTQPYSIRITTDSGLLGYDYQFEDSQNGIDNTLKKRTLRVFGTYDLYKNDGTWDATTEFTWSSYVPVMPDIYWHSYHVRGSNGQSLGYILTTPVTMKDAKLYLQDSDQQTLAAATLDLKNKELQIYSAEASTVGVATLKKSVNSDNEWFLTVSKPSIADHRLIKFLSSIVIDNYFTDKTSFIGALMADLDLPDDD